MALLDDIGVQPSGPPQPTGTLLQDIGYTPPKPVEAKVSAHPVTDELADVIPNTAKHLAVGVGKLADIPGQVWDLAFHPEGAEPADISTAVTKKIVGPTKNEGTLGRVVGAGIESAPAAVLGGPESLIPTMASGAASQTAAEMGAGPTGQFVAGLTPFAPSALAGAARRIVRGGAEGAANMEQNIQNAQQAGLQLSAGQLADNTALRSSETVGSKLPGGSPIKETRGPGLNNQVEESVNNIVRKLAPTTNQTPPTPVSAGKVVKYQVQGRINDLKDETTAAREGMEEAVGGKDTAWSAPRLENELAKVTGPTGMEEVDKLVTGTKTKAVAKTVNSVAQQPRIPTSYSVDGNGAHNVTSPNGQTQAVEDASNNVKVLRSDTAPEAQGKGEGTARLEVLAHIASGKGKSLVSDMSISPAEAAAYEKLANKGWNVQKNPKAEVNPETGNLISDSPKNPVYTVTAPKKTVTGVVHTPDEEQHFTGEWTYDPATGKTEPVTAPKQPQFSAQFSPELNQPTPWTFDSLRALRTNIGQSIGRTSNSTQQGQLKLLYGAISDDLSAGVTAKGPKAEQAYNLFNSTAKTNAETQKTLVRGIKKLGGPEAVYQAALDGSKIGASKIEPIFSSLNEDGQNQFRATILHRMGRQGGAADAPFDANTFMKNWQAMSPEAKNLLFNTKEGWGAPGQLRTALDSLNSSLNLLKKQGYIKSGLGKESSAVQHTMMGGVVALIGERAIEAGVHFAHGNHLAGAVAIGTGAGILTMNPIMSRVLTNPKTVAWLAQTTRAPRGMMPVLINQLNQMGNKDPDAKDLYDLISQQQGNQ